MARTRAASSALDGSTATRARSVARLTSAPRTPLTPRSASSTLATQDAHVIPVTTRSRCSRSLVCGGAVILWLPLAAGEFEDVAELAENLILAALSERRRDTAREMTAEKLGFETLQRPLDGVGLLEHIDAINILVDHSFDRLDVAFDARETRAELVLLFHPAAPDVSI